MEVVVNHEELSVCPYNKSHQIRKSRMGSHIIKCRKNYPGSRIIACDFNVLHQIHESEIQYHHEHCPNRKDAEITVYREHGKEIDRYPVDDISFRTNECWDNNNSVTYNSKEYCEKNHIIRQLSVESSDKKKNFLMTERSRITKFSEDSCDQKPVVKEPTPVPKPLKFRKPVFLPKTSNNTVSTEVTPDSATDLIQRIKRGANQVFNKNTKEVK